MKLLWKNGTNGYLFVAVFAVISFLSFAVAFFGEPTILLFCLSLLFAFLSILAVTVYRVAKGQQNAVNKFLFDSGFTKVLAEADVAIYDGRMHGVHYAGSYFRVEFPDGFVVIGGICATNMIYHHFSFRDSVRDLMVIREEGSDSAVVFGR